MCHIKPATFVSLSVTGHGSGSEFFFFIEIQGQDIGFLLFFFIVIRILFAIQAQAFSKKHSETRTRKVRVTSTIECFGDGAVLPQKKVTISYPQIHQAFSITKLQQIKYNITKT